MIVQEIIERLTSDSGSPFALVEGAASLASIKDSPPQCPAAYVLIKEEASAENSRMNGVLQRTELDVAVVLFADNVSDANGAGAMADIDVLKAAVRARLIGWQPASAVEAMTNVGGSLARARGGLVVWEMVLGAVTYEEG